MRSTWNIVSFLAVVNMLALIGFGTWLWQADRLSRQRIQTVREMFGPTVADAEAAVAAAEAEDAQLVLEARRQYEDTHPPLPSADQIKVIGLVRAQEVQAERRLDDQAAQLMARLEERSRLLQEREAAVAAREAAWRAELASAVDEYRTEQFTKTVALWQALPAKQAKQILVELVAQGGLEQAVRYIDAMNARSAAKIIRELKSDEENALATELLERLRALEPIGTPAETASHDNASDSNAALAAGDAEPPAP